ncbi:hypothetical protein Leryth_005647 [Lithospermum erythrorhizon]|nr:hypothetical protein Leryth_005647 [Lithospermum erythrorhizon]
MEASLNRQDVTKALSNDCSEDLMDDEDFGVHASNPQSRQYMQTNGGYGQHLPTSSSFGSGEFQNPDRSNEEHKNSIKKEVDLQFKTLIAGMLPVEKLPVGKEDDRESWLEIITDLSLEVAMLLRPHAKGRGMDPIKYVKIKCLASGRCSDR